MGCLTAHEACAMETEKPPDTKFFSSPIEQVGQTYPPRCGTSFQCPSECLMVTDSLFFPVGQGSKSRKD